MPNDYKVARDARKVAEPENKSKIVIEGVDDRMNFGQRNTPPGYKSQDVEDLRHSLTNKVLGWMEHKTSPLEGKE
jgi:hypothetical protein